MKRQVASMHVKRLPRFLEPRRQYSEDKVARASSIIVTQHVLVVVGKEGTQRSDSRLHLTA